jgi:2-methylcitrate dehydratase
MKELQNYQIADFALGAKYEDVGQNRIEQLKRHLLDSLGSLIFSLRQPPIQKLRRQIKAMQSTGPCPVPGIRPVPFDRAAQYYTALIRYPDFMDNFLGKEATCHPSDNIGPLLALSRSRSISGRDFLTAMAVAYQVECRLVTEIPVMKEGIDHTLFLSYSILTSAARIMNLNREQLANGLAIAGCSICPMVTPRASYTYEWKGFASAQEAFACINTAFLAKEGMTGPIALFEGPKGFGEIFNMKLDFDWRNENFSLIDRCILKKYNAEAHTQSAVDAAMLLRNEHSIDASKISEVEVTTFMTAYHITGSGSYGDRQQVKSKEQADHSMFYVVAAALLDGEVTPKQFDPERINREDIQHLIQKISVRTKLPVHKPRTVTEFMDPYTHVYPEKVMAKVEVTLKSGDKFMKEVSDYPGFFTRPFDWDMTIEKFKSLTDKLIPENKKLSIIEKVQHLEAIPMSFLMADIEGIRP